MILHLPLKKKWFDLINARIKKEEYREIKPYWIKRLLQYASQFDLKLLFTLCCKLMAQGIILCHNHPSGNPKASAADFQMTRRVRDCAQLFEVQLLDHLIITSKGYTTI